MVQSAKHWVFTLNNYTDIELATATKENNFLGKDVKYVVVGKEVGDSGTPHLQGYISFIGRKTARFVKDLIGGRAHVEIARSTPTQAADYCKKDGDFWEHGTVPNRRGKRTDLDVVFERVKAGATRTEIRDEFFKTYAKYHRAIDKLISDTAPVRTWETEVIVYWGKTGTGKTRQVYRFHKLEEIYVHPGDSWFDGYDGHPIVLFDDFSGGEFKLTYLLKLLDRYPMQVPIKGSFVNWVPKKIYITSNKNPEDWYPAAYSEHRAALKRRLKVVTEFK